MKIAFYSESHADQAALAVFAEGILGQPPEPISKDLAASGVTDVLGTLDGVFKGLHYGSDAEALVVVVDADNSPLHDTSHDQQGKAVEDCRLCQLRTIIARARNRLKPRPHLPELKVAVGLAVPAIEAWYLVGKNHLVGEPAWRVGLNSGKPPFASPQLKQMVYGTDRPSLELETERAVAEARRVIQDLSAIRNAFPDGFGRMASEIQSWK